jgi:hypothetical protein
MRTFFVIALTAIALGYVAAPAGAQTTNTRIQPQAGNVNVDGTRKLTEQQKKAPANAAQTQPPKKMGDNKGIGAPPINLQRPH